MTESENTAGRDLPAHPKSLGDPAERERRMALVSLSHVAPLNDLVREIRAARGCGDEVPFVDPLSGGINAKVLLLAEAPGPGAVESGFLSVDNPDQSAAALFAMMLEARLSRHDVVPWNSVPWYLGESGKIRAATVADIMQGQPYLERLLGLLPSARVLLLLGRHAERAAGSCSALSELRVLAAPHPSPRNIAANPAAKGQILAQLQEAAELCKP